MKIKPAWNLIDIARNYEDEAFRLRTSRQTSEDLRADADLFRCMVGNRQAADPNRLKLGLATLFDVAERWCRQHGYKTVAGHGGWIIQREPASPIIASFGDTLVWDGQRITVEAR